MLTTCPDCGERVSSEASDSPKCGRPLRSLFDPPIGLSKKEVQSWASWTVAHATGTISVLLLLSAWASSVNWSQRSPSYRLLLPWNLASIVFFPIISILGFLHLGLADGLTYPLIFINSALTTLLFMALCSAIQRSRHRQRN